MSDSNEQITLTISKADLVAAFVSRIAYNRDDSDDLNHRFHQQIKEMTTARLAELVESTFDESIRRQVSEALEKGWTDYNSWGAAKETKTLPERVSTMLREKLSPGYGKPEDSRLGHIVRDILEDYLRKDLLTDLKEAREAFRAKVNTVLNAKLTEVLAQHLGLDPTGK
jgi:cobalamin biosynthesis protein CobT